MIQKTRKQFAKELYFQDSEWTKQGNWKEDPFISRIHSKTKDKIEMYFELQYPKIMSQGHILVKLRIDTITIYKLVRVMLEYGLVERILSVAGKPYFRFRQKK